MIRIRGLMRSIKILNAHETGAHTRWSELAGDAKRRALWWKEGKRRGSLSFEVVIEVMLIGLLDGGSRSPA